VFLNNVIVFGRLLRSAGFDVPVGTLQELTRALTFIDLGDRGQVFHACRAVLVRRHEQFALFERIFDAFWRDHTNPFEGRATKSAHDAINAGAMSTASIEIPGGADEAALDASPAEGAMAVWSDVESFRQKDFAEFSRDELARARRALARLEWIPGQRRTRRWRSGRGSRIDMRRTLRQGLRTGGEILTLPTRRRIVRPRPLVLLCDVSGSMERYSRMLLQFSHAASARSSADRGPTEVFLFSTSLTRITRQLRTRSIDDAVAAVALAVPDWSGGTRIGASLRHFHQRWGRRVLRQSPVVLIVSDGWDRGDPEELAAQISRLQRSCHRLVWLNPLIGTLDYAPLTRGLQAALPFVDDFLPARTLADLEDLALHLSRLQGKWK
jgi:uncharacterized protein with von Willebrand factor type A (vWA) domain